MFYSIFWDYICLEGKREHRTVPTICLPVCPVGTCRSLVYWGPSNTKARGSRPFFAVSVQVERREALRLEAVQETLNVLQGALQIAYPANHGLPSWEPVRLILEDKETTGSQEISEVSMWTNAPRRPNAPPAESLVHLLLLPLLLTSVELQEMSTGSELNFARDVYFGRSRCQTCPLASLLSALWSCRRRFSTHVAASAFMGVPASGVPVVAEHYPRECLPVVDRQAAATDGGPQQVFRDKREDKDCCAAAAKECW